MFPMVAIALAIAIFIADTVTDLEIAVAVFYVAVVLMSLSFCRRRGVVLVSAGCMALTVISYFLTPTGSPHSGFVNASSVSGDCSNDVPRLEFKSVEVAALEARAISLTSAG